MFKKCYPTWDKSESYGCRHFGVDPDGSFCGHPKSFEVTAFGLSPNAMSREGLCTHGDEGLYELWEGKTKINR